VVSSVVAQRVIVTFVTYSSVKLAGILTIFGPSTGKVIDSVFLGLSGRLVRRFCDRTANRQRCSLFEASQETR
jgi:hypothetical protein